MNAPHRPGLGVALLAALLRGQAPAAASTALYRNQFVDSTRARRQRRQRAIRLAPLARAATLLTRLAAGAQRQRAAAERAWRLGPTLGLLLPG